MKKVTLVLSDGTRFHGRSFGYEQPVAGEVVFNTAMMGYPESLTDPSYAGQMMTLTYPLVGNYGVPPFTIGSDGIATFMESDRIYASAIIVSDYSEQYNHWNAVESLGEWLKREHVPGITGIDTRELTKVHEEVIRTTTAEAAEKYSDGSIKGEIVLVLEGKREEEAAESCTLHDAVELAKRLIADGQKTTEAAKNAAAMTGFKKNDIYRELI